MFKLSGCYCFEIASFRYFLLGFCVFYWGFAGFFMTVLVEGFPARDAGGGGCRSCNSRRHMSMTRALLLRRKGIGVERGRRKR